MIQHGNQNLPGSHHLPGRVCPTHPVRGPTPIVAEATPFVNRFLGKPYHAPVGLPGEIEFVYVGDPMCSWCWGFAPVLDAMADRYASPIRTVVGGLRPGSNAEPLDEISRRTLAEHWDHVEEASGQPFDHGALDRENWVYDTELGAIGVVAMRHLDEGLAFPFFKRLQRAFYAERVDITDPVVYPSLLEGFGVDTDEFMELLEGEDMKREAWRDFAEARRLSATGFPTLLLRLDDEYLIVTRGYLPWETLEPAMTAWLRDRFGADTRHLLESAG
jgi:putative protein-disulfide isomerase